MKKKRLGKLEEWLSVRRQTLLFISCSHTPNFLSLLSWHCPNLTGTVYRRELSNFSFYIFFAAFAIRFPLRSSFTIPSYWYLSELFCFSSFLIFSNITPNLQPSCPDWMLLFFFFVFFYSPLQIVWVEMEHRSVYMLMVVMLIVSVSS